MKLIERLADALFAFRHGLPEPEHQSEQEPEQPEPWFARSCDARQPRLVHPAMVKRQLSHIPFVPVPAWRERDIHAEQNYE